MADTEVIKTIKMSLKYMAIIISITIMVLATYASDNGKEADKVKLSDELIIEVIAQDALLVIHSFPWPSNSLIVKIDEKNLLWIDTPYTSGAAAEVLDWVYMKFGDEIKVTVINTGFHIDNLGGNQELKKRGIQIYGSNLTCELLRTKSKATMGKMKSWLKKPRHKKYLDVYRDFVFTEPTNVFDINEKQIIRLGAEQVEIFFPGPTHTYDNLIVYIPSRKILFGGCMILSQEANRLGFIDDGNVEKWGESIEKVKDRYQTVEVIVPGHGKVGGKNLLDHTIDVVNEFNRRR